MESYNTIYQSMFNKVLKDNKAFFAFNKEQFEEGKTKGILKYTALSKYLSGLIVPSQNVDQFILDMERIEKESKELFESQSIPTKHKIVYFNTNIKGKWNEMFSYLKGNRNEPYFNEFSRFVEVDECFHDHMFNVLPPIGMSSNSFHVGEPENHDINGKPVFLFFYQIGKRYFASYCNTSSTATLKHKSIIKNIVSNGRTFYQNNFQKYYQL